MLEPSAVVLVRRGSLVLGITRKRPEEDPTAIWRWHLPGGKREPFDSDMEATARREFREEIGESIDGLELRKLCVLRSGSGRCVHAFECIDHGALPDSFGLNHSEVGLVAWVPPELMAAEFAPFRYEAGTILRRAGFML